MENKDTITAGKRFTVYGLVNTRTGSIRYIGMTENPRSRANDHRKTYPTLELQVIGECESWDEMAMWEFLFIEFWQPPLNEIPGGGVSPAKDPKVRAKMSVAKKKYWANSAFRSKQSARMKKYLVENPDKHPMKRPEVAAKQSAKASASLKKYWVENPNARAKQSESMKKYWDENPNARAKQSAALKKHCEDPAVRAKRSAAQKKLCEDPAERARRSERMKRFWAERKAAAMV